MSHFPGVAWIGTFFFLTEMEKYSFLCMMFLNLNLCKYIFSYINSFSSHRGMSFLMNKLRLFIRSLFIAYTIVFLNQKLITAKVFKLFLNVITIHKYRIRLY